MVSFGFLIADAIVALAQMASFLAWQVLQGTELEFVRFSADNAVRVAHAIFLAVTKVATSGALSWARTALFVWFPGNLVVANIMGACQHGGIHLVGAEVDDEEAAPTCFS